MPGDTLNPYVTVYPLPSKAFYAIAKTWPDREAPRAGCVLTHTLLVPRDVWMSGTDIAAFASSLRFPRRNGPSLPERVSDAMVEPSDEPAIDDFIAKFFGEGIRPLVWFDAQTAEAITWRLLSALWPALRAEFSCCTHSLQPRALDDRPFDVMFAPLQVRSRFAEYLGAHEVTATRDSQVEPWATEWRAEIFGKMPNSNSSIGDLCSGLDATPNAIRRSISLSISANALRRCHSPR